MLRYKRWYKTMVYQKVVKMGEAPIAYIKEITCDGWFLFSIPLFTRENVNV